MRFAVSRDMESFGEPQVFSTPQKFEDSLETLSKYCEQIGIKGQVGKSMGGLPGPLSMGKDSLLNAPNLGGWIGKPIKSKLEELLGAPVFLENDAALAGLGEALFGGGKGYKIVAYLTISTGIGGARIVEEKIDVSYSGFEPGHQIIDADGTICAYCKKKVNGKTIPGDLEDHISGAGLKKRFLKEASEIDSQEVWEKVAELLAYGLNNTIVHWSPEVVILGGPLILEDKISIEKTKETLKDVLGIYPALPEIKKAQLGDKAGLFGSLAYLKHLQ